MMNMIPTYSTQGLPDWPLADIFELLRRFDYQGVEIAVRREMLARVDDGNYWKEIRYAADAAGITITALHIGDPRLYTDPAEPRWLHPDPARRAYHADLIRAEGRIAEALGCPRIMTASGAAPEGAEPAAHWELLVGELNAAARELPAGVELLLEHEPEHFIRSVNDILKLHERTDGRVWSTVDVGHLEVAGEPIPESIARLAPVMRNIHLEDISNREHKHLLPGDGDIDFDALGGALREINYTGPLTIDLYPFAATPVPALLRGRDLIRRLCE